MGDYYKLVGKQAVPVQDVIEWGNEMEKLRSERGEHVADTRKGDIRVSTVFLGLDHAFGHGPPLLFETMVFKGDSWSEQDADRYTTWEEAEAGHKAMCEKWLKDGNE